MRHFAFFMTLLVLALSCMPCKDGATAMNTCKAQAIAKSTGEQQDNDHDDACSPFCHCTCCAAFVFHVTPSPVTVTAPAIATTYTDAYASRLVKVAIPVWQPPQLL